MQATETHAQKRPVGRPRKGLSESNLKQSKLILNEAQEDDIEAELSEIEKLELQELDKIREISGKYTYMKFKYGIRMADEFRMRVLHSFVLKKFPNNVIASAFNISLVHVWRLRKQLSSHICKQVSRVSFNQQLGESLILKDQLRAEALKAIDRVAKMEGLPEWDKERLRSHLRMEAEAHDNAKWALMKLAIGDAKKYEPDYKGYKPLDDANEIKAILEAIVTGDDATVEAITKGRKDANNEVLDDFIIE